MENNKVILYSTSELERKGITATTAMRTEEDPNKYVVTVPALNATFEFSLPLSNVHLTYKDAYDQALEMRQHEMRKIECEIQKVHQELCTLQNRLRALTNVVYTKPTPFPS